MNRVIKMGTGVVLIALFIFLFSTPKQADAFSFGYADQSNYSSYEPAGFFSGVWHGMIAPYTLLVRFFSPINSKFNVDMYAYNNTGWFYDLGFLIGITISLPIGWIAAIVALVIIMVA